MSFLLKMESDITEAASADSPIILSPHFHLPDHPLLSPMIPSQIFRPSPEGKKSDTEAAGRRTGRDRQSCVKMGEWKIIPGHQSDRATVSDTGYQCQ